MAINPVKALLFLAGGAAAAATTAYVTGVFDGFAEKEPAVVAAAPDDGTQDRPSGPSAGIDSSGKQSRPAPEGQETETREVLAPTFDVVRVEPNGSIVIAGAASGNSEVEVLAGTSLIGTARANAAGDFALVLDEPLAPGDYQIVLRATTPDGLAATSIETAVVSVPETESGQVLALVEEPGKPSKLITVPEAKPVEEKIPQDVLEAPAPPASASAEAQNAPAETPSEQRSDDEASSQSAQETPSDTGSASGEAVEKDLETARVEPDQAAAVVEGAEPQVAVEAVEIEGRQVFVAGSATPGASVRVYANDILLGDARASEGGRFLVEAQRDMPVGDYIVRADVLDETGSEVLARAAVPFQREAGENLSAVAPQKAAEDADAAAPEVAVEAPATRTQQQTGTATQEGASGVNGPVRVTEEATAPKLENVDGSVIIRRGDTLWQISRRVYGRGVRYSTIYLANQDQISDPDLIWPGQVFKVPGTTDEGEEADLDALGLRRGG